MSFPGIWAVPHPRKRKFWKIFWMSFPGFTNKGLDSLTFVTSSFSPTFACRNITSMFSNFFSSDVFISRLSSMIKINFVPGLDWFNESLSRSISSLNNDGHSQALSRCSDLIIGGIQTLLRVFLEFSLNSTILCNGHLSSSFHWVNGLVQHMKIIQLKTTEL